MGPQLKLAFVEVFVPLAGPATGTDQRHSANLIFPGAFEPFCHLDEFLATNIARTLNAVPPHTSANRLSPLSEVIALALPFDAFDGPIPFLSPPCQI